MVLWKWLRTTYFGVAVSYAFVILGSLSTFSQTLGIFDINLFHGQWGILLLFVIVSIIGGLIAAIQREPVVNFRTGLTIRLVPGDILNEKGPTYIGFSDSFGVNEKDGISESSLQGKYLKAVWGGNAMGLKAAIESGFECEHGAAGQHEVGCVSVVMGPNNQRAYCVAQSHLGLDNRAQSSASMVALALGRFYDAVDRHENHGAISIPLIGQGLSRINGFSPTHAIQLSALIAVSRAATGRFSKELRIVLEPSVYKQVNKREILVFLRSLT
jgi:Domain of unknown function (DUF6430)